MTNMTDEIDPKPLRATGKLPLPAALATPAPPLGSAAAIVDFEAFVGEVEPGLRRAFLGRYGLEGARDATAEALAWAWEHWPDVQAKNNPSAYLCRVGQSKSRSRQQGRLPAPDPVALPEVEPRLVPALQSLTEQQRTAVWLVHGCDWSYAQCAEAMEISASAVGTHVSRGLEGLRRALEAHDA